MNHVNNERLITDAELATWLSVSKATLHKLREEGALPFRLIGTCIRYSVPEIDEWLLKNSKNSASRNEPQFHDFSHPANVEQD